MDLAALLIGALSAILTAAIGFFAVWAAGRFWHLHASPYVGAAVGAVVGLLGSVAVIGGLFSSLAGLTEAKVAVDEVLPYMELIKTHEPALYERIETSVIRDQEEGIGSEQVRANAKSLVMSYVADKTIVLPDQLTYELFATTRDQMVYLAEHGEHKACADLALGRAKGDVDTKLTQELVERVDNTTARVISTTADQSVSKMPAEEFAQLATRSFSEASQATGIPPEEVDGLLLETGDPTKACKLMKAFFDSILAQPVEVAAAALRALSAGERSPTQ